MKKIRMKQIFCISLILVSSLGLYFTVEGLQEDALKRDRISATNEGTTLISEKESKEVMNLEQKKDDRAEEISTTVEVNLESFDVTLAEFNSTAVSRGYSGLRDLVLAKANVQVTDIENPDVVYRIGIRANLAAYIGNNKALNIEIFDENNQRVAQKSTTFNIIGDTPTFNGASMNIAQKNLFYDTRDTQGKAPEEIEAMILADSGLESQDPDYRALIYSITTAGSITNSDALLLGIPNYNLEGTTSVYNAFTTTFGPDVNGLAPVSGRLYIRFVQYDPNIEITSDDELSLTLKEVKEAKDADTLQALIIEKGGISAKDITDLEAPIKIDFPDIKDISTTEGAEYDLGFIVNINGSEAVETIKLKVTNTITLESSRRALAYTTADFEGLSEDEIKGKILEDSQFVATDIIGQPIIPTVYEIPQNLLKNIPMSTGYTVWLNMMTPQAQSRTDFVGVSLDQSVDGFDLSVEDSISLSVKEVSDLLDDETLNKELLTRSKAIATDTNYPDEEIGLAITAATPTIVAKLGSYDVQVTATSSSGSLSKIVTVNVTNEIVIDSYKKSLNYLTSDFTGKSPEEIQERLLSDLNIQAYDLLGEAASVELETRNLGGFLTNTPQNASFIVVTRLTLPNLETKTTTSIVTLRDPVESLEISGKNALSFTVKDIADFIDSDSLKAELIRQGEFKGLDSNYPEEEVTFDIFQMEPTIEAKVGSYEVLIEATSTSGSVLKSMTVTVTNEIIIDSYTRSLSYLTTDFTGKSHAEIQEQIRSDINIQAHDLLDNPVVTELVISENLLNNIPQKSIYVVFTVLTAEGADKKSVTSLITLRDPVEGLELSALDSTTFTVKEVNDLIKSDTFDSELLAKVDASAVDSTKPEEEVQITVDQITPSIEAKAGEYDALIEATSSSGSVVKWVSVKVTNKANLTFEKKFLNYVTSDLEGLSTLEIQEKILADSGATAVDLLGESLPIELYGPSANEGIFQNIPLGISNFYVIGFQVSAPNIETVAGTVFITLVKDAPDLELTAEDFSISEKEVAELVAVNQAAINSEVLLRSKAKAIDTTDPEADAELSIIRIEPEIAATAGDYAVLIGAKVGELEKALWINAEVVHGELRFKQVSPEVSFQDAKIQAANVLIPRQDNWNIVVEDLRTAENNWHVDVKLTQNFINTKDKLLDGGLVFLQESEEKEVVLGEAITVYRAADQPNSVTSVMWDNNKGLLLKVLPSEYKGNYTGRLEWLLIDDPSVSE